MIEAARWFSFFYFERKELEMRDRNHGLTERKVALPIRFKVGCFLLLVLLLPLRYVAADGNRLPSQALPRIPPGTIVGSKQMEGFSDLVIFVKGNLSAGDTSVVSSTVKYYGDLFNLVYLANVEKHPEKGFLLDQVCVGFATKIKGRDTIVSTETESQLGAGLNFIGRSVLAGNEKALEDVTMVAKNDFGALIDAPAFMYRDEKHKLMIVRFFVWVSPDGKVGTCSWLLDKVGNGQYVMAEDTFQYLPPKMVENRILHVDGSKFTLGIPSPDAFALVSIPQGRAYPVTEAMKELATKSTYTVESFNQFAAALSEAMTQQK
jgi:hypothetical protein